MNPNIKKSGTNATGFIALFGGTGLIGSAIANELILKKYRLKLFIRDMKKIPPGFIGQAVIPWDLSNDDWKQEIDGSYAVVNFTGEPIFKRWNAEYKRRIYASRIDTVKHIVDAISKSKIRPKVFVNGTASGYYGYDCINNSGMDEDSEHGDDFWGKLVFDWENAATRGSDYSMRVVNIRTGIVLSLKGGSLPELVSLFKKDLGGPIRPGNQWFPWIHIDDEVGLAIWSMNNDAVVGPINAVSPQSSTMKEFAKTLGSVLNKPSRISVPSTIIKLRMGEVSELILRGKKIIPKKAIELGYTFKHPDLEEALKSILRADSTVN